MRAAKKMLRQMSVFLLMFVMVIGVMTVTVNANAEKTPLGHVVVSVEKFSIGQGYMAEPMIVPFYEDTNGAGLLMQVLEANGLEASYTGKIESGFYLSSIKDTNGDRTAIFNNTIKKVMEDDGVTPDNPRESDNLGEFDYTFASGWLYTIDNVRAGYGLSDLTPQNGLTDGSVLRLQFSAYGFGADLGIDNGGYGEYLPVVDRDELTALIAQTKSNWEVLSGNQQVMAAYEKAVEVISNTENDSNVTQKAAETLKKALEDAAKPDTEELIQTVKSKIAQKYVGTLSPWGIIDACGDNNRDALTTTEEFLQSALNVFKQESPLATDMEKYIMAVSALGVNARAVPDGDHTFDAIEKMAQVFNSVYNEETQSIAVNSLIFALNAYDSGAYEIPKEQEINTRDGLIRLILDKRKEDGGWAFYGSKYDPDMTGMALHALAPYYTASSAEEAGIEQETYQAVRAAVDQAVSVLANAYQENGTFGGRSANSNSLAIVMAAFHALGIDSHEDARLIKDGVSAMDSLLTFVVDTQDGFKWMLSNSSENAMATEQGYMALISYVNMKETGKPYNIYNCGVKIIPPLKVDVTGVVLDKDSAVMEVGENLKLNASIFPENATNKNLIWTSSNENVATVDTNGFVSAGRIAGETVITVTTEDGAFFASCKIQVKNTALENAKDTALKEINDYKHADDYRQAEKEQLKAIIEDASKKIAGAVSEEEINGIVENAKTQLDKLKTDAQWKEEGNKTVVNKEFGASIKGEEIREGMDLQVSPLKVTDAAVKAMQREIPSTQALVSLYEYQLLDHGKEVTLTAPVTLTFQVDEKYNGMELEVLRWADGKVEKLYGKVENGILSVTTDKLGSFAVVVDAQTIKQPSGTDERTPVTKGDASVTKQTQTKNKTMSSIKTGDESQAMLFILMAGAALLTVLSKRRKAL